MLAAGRCVEIWLESRSRYRLRFVRDGVAVVEYANAGAGHRRRRDGRAQAYEFRSVEQLRYDFERDVEDAQHPG